MGKKFLLTIIAVIIAVVLAAQKQSSAMDIGVGGVAWYTQWDAYGGGPSEGVDPAFMYGGILSMGFLGDWSISTVFLYGRFDLHGSGNGPDTIERYDSDTSLNYNVFRYLKCIIGVKLMGYFWDKNGFDEDHYSVGPAAGFGVTIPLIWNFYIAGNVTGIYTFGRQHKQGSSGQEEATVLHEYGVNSTVGLVYYIEAISTTLMVGFRSQFFRLDYDSDREQDGDFHFWGAYASVVYSFGLFE